MLSRLAGAVVVALALLALADASAQAATPRCLKPVSWVAGQTALCEGAVVYGDYIGDDYGADDGQVPSGNRIGQLSPGAGDQDYPAGQENSADLVRLTLRVSGDHLLVTALLNALHTSDETVLALTFDTDDDQSTGGGQWRGLGIRSRGWEKQATFRTGDPVKNTISGRLRLPPGETWRVQAVLANRDTGEVMNVAFRPKDHPGFGENPGAAGTDSSLGSFFEDDQAEALRNGDISRFGFRVAVEKMKEGATRHPRLVTGLRERVYTSDYKLGEGMSYEGVPGRGDPEGPELGFEQRFNFLSRYQPYGVYIPKKPAPHGIQFVFHGSGSNLSGLVAQPGMQQRFGEDLNRIVVTPEGRGTEGWGSDISERDLLDVLTDLRATYNVDRDRIFAGGYSQGGYVTYRMASLHPDLFAGAVDWVGFTGDGANGGPPGSPSYTAGAIGNAPDFVKNLLHVPTVMLYAAGDELVHAWTGLHMNQVFQGTDNVYRFYNHPGAEHLTFAALDDWRKEAAYTKGLERVRNPARVLFTTARFLDSARYGIRHDHAYWVSRIRGRGAKTDYATVDLTSAGCGGSLPALARSSGAGTDPVAWTSDDQRVVSRTPLAKAPKLTGTLTNVKSARIDAARTCLAGKAVAYDITSDGPSTLTLSDGRTLSLPGGRSVGTLARR